MENYDESKVGTEVWILIKFSLGQSVGEGLCVIGVYEGRERAESALVREYEDTLELYDDGNIPDLFFIQSAPIYFSFQNPPASIASGELKSKL